MFPLTARPTCKYHDVPRRIFERLIWHRVTSPFPRGLFRLERRQIAHREVKDQAVKKAQLVWLAQENCQSSNLKCRRQTDSRRRYTRITDSRRTVTSAHGSCKFRSPHVTPSRGRTSGSVLPRYSTRTSRVLGGISTGGATSCGGPCCSEGNDCVS